MVRRTGVARRLFNIGRHNSKKRRKKPLAFAGKNIPLQCFSDDNESIITAHFYPYYRLYPNHVIIN